MLINAAIACEPSRYDQLKLTVLSIYDQVDMVHLYLNEFAELPKWIYDFTEGKVKVYTGKNEHYDLADNGKFFPLEQIKEPCYYLGCDSDLIYPIDYVQKLIHWIDTYQSIISFHGRVLKAPVEKYYGNSHKVYDFRGGQMSSHKVHVVGTGVMGFRTDYFCPTELHKSPDKRMSDLVFSLEAHKQGKTLICVEHSAQWITQQPVEDSIFKTESSGNQLRQIELANEILRVVND